MLWCQSALSFSQQRIHELPENAETRFVLETPTQFSEKNVLKRGDRVASSENAIWAEWKKVTQFIGSSRIAFRRECLLCSSLEPLDPSATRVVISEGSRIFKSTLEEHARTMQDDSLLFSVGLLTSYALTESFARIKLSIPENVDLPGGIEAWGTSFLQRTRHDWTYVVDGLQGIIEVSVARNFAAHGTAIVTQNTINRFRNLGLQCPWPKGGSITMDCLP